jgi:ABC-type glycerol-3-phosphate transport system substrate-binding protein
LVTFRQAVDNKEFGVTQFVKDKNIAFLDNLANVFLSADMSSVNWELISYPTFKELPNKGPQTLPTLFGITYMSKNKDAAMRVLKYMVSEEVQLEISENGAIPVLQDDKVL